MFSHFMKIICFFLKLKLKESFKDTKKKFNNLKFNYSKKNEKTRNLRTLKYQIQQVDTYGEKMQVMGKYGMCVCVYYCSCCKIIVHFSSVYLILFFQMGLGM